MKLPWRRLSVIILGCIVIGNSALTLLLYMVGRPELTAWTGKAMESTPGATNDLLLGLIILIVGLYLVRHE